MSHASVKGHKVFVAQDGRVTQIPAAAALVVGATVTCVCMYVCAVCAVCVCVCARLCVCHLHELCICIYLCVCQGSTQDTQNIRVDTEQPVQSFRVSRNCF